MDSRFFCGTRAISTRADLMKGVLYMKNRIKNPYFWIGLIGVILTAMGVNAESFTSWQAVGDALTALIANPYLLGSVATAVLGIFVDPSTKGLKDGDK